MLQHVCPAHVGIYRKQMFKTKLECKAQIKVDELIDDGRGEIADVVWVQIKSVFAFPTRDQKLDQPTS